MRISFINSWVPKTMLDFIGLHYYRSLQKKKKKQHIFSKVYLLVMFLLNALWEISFIVKYTMQRLNSSSN
jgi:hypothetical protein